MSWSIRSREGPNTPSLEEFFWYHVLPGGIYRTATAEGGTESEEFDYFVLSGLTWFAGIAWAADAAAAAQALGATNVAAEWALLRPLTYLQIVGYSAPYVAATAAGTYTGMQIVEGSGVPQQTLEIAQGRPSKPWWMPLPLYVQLYG